MPIPLTASRPAALTGLPGILFPGDPGFDEARLPWNLAVDLRPAAVAVPRTADDVAAIVTAASQHGLRVCPLSTGHLALYQLHDGAVRCESTVAREERQPLRRGLTHQHPVERVAMVKGERCRLDAVRARHVEFAIVRCQ